MVFKIQGLDKLTMSKYLMWKDKRDEEKSAHYMYLKVSIHIMCKQEWY